MAVSCCYRLRAMLSMFIISSVFPLGLACFLRNCPLGGKRSILEVVHHPLSDDTHEDWNYNLEPHAVSLLFSSYIPYSSLMNWTEFNTGEFTFYRFGGEKNFKRAPAPKAIGAEECYFRSNRGWGQSAPDQICRRSWNHALT